MMRCLPERNPTQSDPKELTQKGWASPGKQGCQGCLILKEFNPTMKGKQGKG